MKKGIYALLLISALAVPAGTASAHSDDDRPGYWGHRLKTWRERGGSQSGWRQDWWDWWRARHQDDEADTSDGSDTTPEPEVETVDEAQDGHTGSDD